MHNDTEEVWKNVSVTDVLDLSRLHLVSDSVKVNGIQLPWGQYQYNIDETSLKDTMVIPVGDIQPGSTATVEFQVRFENDGASDPYVNSATVTSDNHDNIEVDAPTVTFTNIGVITGQHVKLFAGYTDGAWWPDVEKNGQNSKFLSLEEACCVVARSITAEQRGDLLGGKSLSEASAGLSDVWPKEEWYAGPVRFMGAIKALQDPDVDYDSKVENTDWYNYNGNTPRMVATREQLGRMITAVGLDAKLASAEYSDTDPNHMTARHTFANEMAKILNRDSSPDFNSCERPNFTDTQSSLVSEVSIFHSYVLHGKNNKEIWTFSDANRGVEI